MLRVSCYEKVTAALCGFFKLPDVALIFAGCSENPLSICWLVSADLLPYIKSQEKGWSGERMLTEEKIAQIAVGDDELYKDVSSILHKLGIPIVSYIGPE